MKKFLVSFLLNGKRLQDEFFANSPYQAQTLCKQRYDGCCSVSAYLLRE
jgi:hypothetical protein